MKYRENSSELEEMIYLKANEAFLTGWVYIIRSSDSLSQTDDQFQMKSVLVNSMSTIVKPFEYISNEFNDAPRRTFRRLTS